MRWPPWRRDAPAGPPAGLPDGAVRLARRLPDPETLRARARGLAVLDAVLIEDPDSRTFDVDTRWAADEELASMDDGSGNAWSMTSTPAGVWLRGFDHESPMSPWGDEHDLDWLAAVPGPLRPAAAEPAFTGDGLPLVTVACWRLHDDEDWHPVQLRSSVAADTPDGSDWLFAELEGDDASHAARLEEIHEVEVDPRDVGHVLALRPLSEELVRRLNPDRRLVDLAEDVARIGYPGPT
ncbi:hypothetical protein [Kineococcus sp. SYSU DK001]|uniref:hypothetical protein n=1 Tax=Kineococcus sp. SYSU DK001 TaxID=3383122 RepID=UPI003D7E5461